MLRTKKDVERHVSDILNKINSENEKNLRGYAFARLFFQVKDYSAAKKYLSGFLSVRDHHAPAQKLLAQIYEATNERENALYSYKRSLELDSHQTDIILRICDLYCHLPVDHETARYWADRAEQLFPHNPIVFKLRECMVSADGEPDHEELENLIAKELAVQPKDVGLRMRLLRLYLDTERLKKAYEHATMIESKRFFPYNVDWYYLLGDIFEAYQEEHGQELDSQFYLNYLTALDRLIYLTLSEPHSFPHENGMKQHSVNDVASILLTFDQLLKVAAEKNIREASWTYFIQYMKGQLYFNMASLLMKRNKMEQGNRKEALKFSAGLGVVCYTFRPMNLIQEIWFSNLDENQRFFASFFQQNCLRTSFMGHALVGMCKEDKAKWLQKLKLDVCIPQVKEKVYARIFNTVVKKEKLLSSYFILDTTYEKVSLEFPSEATLNEFDKVTCKFCPDSLHHLVWLEMHRKNTGFGASDSLSEVFKDLKYSNKNLSNGSCDSLCILDLESYLLATVYQAECLQEKKQGILSPKFQESPLSYPPDISEAMCSRQQASWWRSAYGLHNNTIKEKLGDHRRDLQHGLEVIRGIGNHGMEIQLVVHLARMFAKKADNLLKNLETRDAKKMRVKPDNVAALQYRAIHYWKLALDILDKMSSGDTTRVLKSPKERVFSGQDRPLSMNDIKMLQEDGKLYIAVHLMDCEKLNEAADILSGLHSPYGSYYLAMTLLKLASQEDKFSTTKGVLLARAQTAIHETMDRTKDDKSHPLNQDIYLVLEDIESELALDSSINNVQNGNDHDETDSYGASPEFGSSLYLTPNSNPKPVTYSTPRPFSQFKSNITRVTQNSHPIAKHFEPSPERLDAQLRALNLNHDTIVKTLLEQQKMFLDSFKTIADTLKPISETLTDLKKFMQDFKLSYETKALQKGASRRQTFPKTEEDEDYTDFDPSNYPEFYPDEGNEDFRNPGYTYSQSSRMVQEAVASASLNYVMSPAIPPGTPAALNHYNYQYPPHAVLPPPAIAERASYYQPTAGQGLPFSEGQQLPQFHFHVASTGLKTPVGNIPPGLALPPPPPPAGLHPSQPVLPPPPNATLPLASPWTKSVGVPHAFQIPLPASTPFSMPPPPNLLPPTVAASPLISPVPATSQSELKNLLKSPASAAPLQQVASTALATTTSPSIFAGISKAATVESPKLERSRCDSDAAGNSDYDGDLEKEVMGNFKPVIPLPAEIVVETGEENEVVLFEDRAKLYRYVNQEWKERGIGIVKILHHNSSDRVRLLMRRDQVLKVCANHYITPNMEINSLKTSDKAWTWTAQDFADEELKPEHFCIRFKTAEIAVAFKIAFEKSISIVKDAEGQKATSSYVSTTETSSASQSSLSKFLPKIGSWTCPTCYVSNAPDRNLCVACETTKPGKVNLSTGSPKSVSWTCSTCFVSNTGDKLSCIACNTKKIAISITNAGDAPAYSASSQSEDSTKAPNEKQFLFGVPVSFPSSIVKTDANTKSIFGGFSFSASPKIHESGDQRIAKDQEILVVSTKSKNGPQVTKVNQSTPSPFSGFSFTKSPVNTSNFTVHVSGDSRNVTASNEKSNVFGSLPVANATAPPSTDFTSVASLGTSDNSLAKMQAMVQGIAPTYVFDPKDSSKTADAVGDNAHKPSVTAVSPSTHTGSPEEFVPTAEFKPVVSLPALVDIKTGEEEEEKLFEERAKLFRYDATTKEWKERGTGELKILHQKDTLKYRILMRRDQVLKLCANHLILPDVKLTPLPNTDKAWVWFAHDYSEGALAEEKFAARFKNSELAKKFFSVFQKCQEALKVSATSQDMFVKSPSDKCVGNSDRFDQLLKPSDDSWNCNNCKKSNMNASSCVYCQSPKENAAAIPKSAQQKPLSELFKPEVGSWECNSCYVRNKHSDNNCVSCNSPKSGVALQPSDASVAATKSQSLTEMFKPATGSWECQTCLVRNNDGTTKCASCETPKPGSAPQSSSVFGAFKLSSSNSLFGSGTKTSGFGSANSNLFGSFGPSNSTVSESGFGKLKSEGEFVFGKKPTSQPTTFPFGTSTINNKENQINDASSKTGNTTTTTAPVSIFGSFSSPKPGFESLASAQKSNEETSEFRFGSPQKYEFNFTGVRPRSPVKTPKSPRSPASPDVEDEDEGDSDVDNIYFPPLIPLPPKIDVKTGEEDESVIFCRRAKLYRFTNGEWKERGIGDMKLLFDNKTEKYRLLMRREQVLKVCLNHYLNDKIKFEKRSDKSWSWAATDFSESEPSPELLAVRFKTSELADEFKLAIDIAMKKPTESPVVSKEIEIPKSTTSFSFKSDTPKSESNFSVGSLSSRFGTSGQGKPVFGGSPPGAFGSSGLKNNQEPSSPFAFSFKEKAASSVFFGQPPIPEEDSSSPDQAFVKGFSFGAVTKDVAPKVVDEDIEIIYVASASSKHIELAEEYKLPKNFFLYETKEPCPGCRGCTDTIPEYKVVSEVDLQETVTTEVEAPVKDTPAAEEANLPFSYAKFDSFSFSDLATKSGFQDLSKSPTAGKNIFAGAGTPLFANLNTSGDNTGDDVAQGPDVHFEPIIPLPDLVEVKTGEEDEVPLFVYRAKLFRYDSNTKQWKERGVGDIKILQHKEKTRFRIIMRRDQVHNVACNHFITEQMSLSPLATSDSAVCWHAMDYSDGQNGEASQFAVRFKSKEQLNQFNMIFNDCREKLKNAKECPQEHDFASGATLNQVPLSQSNEVTVESSISSNGEPPRSAERQEENKRAADVEEDEDDDEDEILFEKRCSLEICDDASGNFKSEGCGDLRITYDDDVFGYRITMTNAGERVLCDHIIALQTCLRVEGKKATWSAIDFCLDPARRRQFRATFSSTAALKDFSAIFEEGKEIAVKQGIVENTDPNVVG